MVANERKLLLRDGHEVFQYTLHNNAITQMPGIQAASKALWNGDAYTDLRTAIRQHGIDLVHAHNTFPLVSPAIYYAAAAEKTPVVQTLHNYRLLCPAATLFRAGAVCEDCMQKRIPFPALAHRCYRGSFAASAVTMTMLGAHRFAGTYESKVSAYIALSEFAKRKFVEGGLPEERLRVKANCLAEDPGMGGGLGGYALFAGRLSPEKGVLTMLDAWEKLAGFKVELRIAGDGPLKQQVAERAAKIPGVKYLGKCDKEPLFQLMRNAAALMFPSEWYEGSPMAVIEALACGTPVIGGALGGLPGMLTEGLNGFIFESGNAADMAACVQRAFNNPAKLAAMRLPARRSFEEHFNARDNLKMLLSIYQSVLARSLDTADVFAAL